MQLEAASTFEFDELESRLGQLGWVDQPAPKVE